jgi:beta-lactamase regulating signal transducer with metallopeptidase domain/lipopolysaccharide export system protein LptA
MNNLIPFGGGGFRWILQSSWQAAVLAGLILGAQWLLRKRLSPAWRHGLWLLLVVRLLMPISPPSIFSIFNLGRLGPQPSVVTSSLPVPALAIGTEPVGIFPDAALILPPSTGNQAIAKANWIRFAFWGYLAGVVFFAARLVWTNGRFHSRIRGYQPIADEKVTRLFNDCRAVLKLRQTVRLIESEEVESPAVYGLWQKWLLLPDGSLERFSEAELRCIFLHELGHIKRGDLGVNWVVGWLQVLHWFNPLLWLAWARMRVERELATDALALHHIPGHDPVRYGETILKVLEGLTGERALPGLVGIAEHKTQLKERLAAIGREGHYWRWLAPALAAVLAMIGLTDAPAGKAQTQPAAASNSEFPRQKPKISDQSPPTTAPAPALDAQQLHLRQQWIENEKSYHEQLAQLQKFKSVQQTDPNQLPDVLARMVPDATLSELLSRRDEARRRWATLTNDYSSTNIVVRRARSLIDEVDHEIEDRAAGIMASLETQVKAKKAAQDMLRQYLPPQALSSPPVVVSAGHFQSDENRRHLEYFDQVVVTHGQERLACERLTVNLPPDGTGHPTNAVAETNVDIIFMDDKGQTNHLTCDQGIYDYSVANQVTNETFTFRGHATVRTAQGLFNGEPMVWDPLKHTFYSCTLTKMRLEEHASDNVPNNPPINLRK